MQKKPNFRVELYFDPEADNLDEVCSATDEIFSSYKMPCIERGRNSRVYTDNGEARDCGKLIAALSKIKRNPELLKHVSDGIFDWGDKRETLMTNFFKRGL